MTLPLMALAVGAIVAGFVSIPPALGGSAVLEHFLEPSFTAQRLRRMPPRRGAAAPRPKPRREAPRPKPRTKSRTSRTSAELGLDGVLGDDRAHRHL